MIRTVATPLGEGEIWGGVLPWCHLAASSAFSIDQQFCILLPYRRSLCVSYDPYNSVFFLPRCGDPLLGSPSPTQARHRLSLTKCLEALGRFVQHEHLDLALAAEDLRQARRHLGQLTGQLGAEEILTVIFKDFCIGK